MTRFTDLHPEGYDPIRHGGADYGDDGPQPITAPNDENWQAEPPMGSGPDYDYDDYDDDDDNAYDGYDDGYGDAYSAGYSAGFIAAQAQWLIWLNRYRLMDAIGHWWSWRKAHLRWKWNDFRRFLKGQKTDDSEIPF